MDILTAKNKVISPNFLVCKFCGKAQFPHSFGQIARNHGIFRSVLIGEYISGLHLPCGCHQYHCFYIFPKNLVYHPTYQAEGWECKTKHFAPVQLHCICYKTISIWLPCHILGKLVTQPVNLINLLHSWTTSLLCQPAWKVLCISCDLTR